MYSLKKKCQVRFDTSEKGNNQDTVYEKKYRDSIPELVSLCHQRDLTHVQQDRLVLSGPQ
jgi:hypothetical protein